MNKSKDKKKRILKKLKKATKGAVSLMLCILITPFLSMAGALVELSRYQMAAQTLQEAIDSSMLSVLAEYDGFLEDRFGLFAVSQDTNMTKEFNKYLDNNSGILGQAAKVNSATLSGKPGLSLAANSAGSYDVLQAQLLDFSETTVATEMVLKNLKVEELIEKLKNITGFGKLTDLASKVETVTKNMKDLVEESEKLYNSAKNLQDNFNTIKNDISDINKQINSLCGQIQNDLDFNFNDYNIVIDENGKLTLERKTPLEGDDDDGKNTIDIMSKIRGSAYKNYFSEISSKANSIVDSVISMKSDIEDLPNKVKNVKDKLQAVKESITALTNKRNDFSNSKDTSETNAADKTETLQKAYEEMADQFESALKDISDELINNIKNDFNSIVKDFENDAFSGLQINNLKSISQDTVKIILNYFTNGSQHSFNDFMKYFLKNSPLSQLINSLSELPQRLYDAVDNAKESIKSSFTQNLIDSLKAIANAVKQLFNLEGIVDTKLCAFIDDSVWRNLNNGDVSNPYSGFLEALSKLVDGLNDLSPASWEGNIFTALFNALKGILTIVSSIGTMFKTILDLIVDKVTSIGEFVKSFGNLSNMGDKLLLSGYMLYNLPNRLNYNNGTALTGFDYKKLPRDTTKYDNYNMNYDNSNPFTAMNNFISGISGKGGLNTTFYGAEAEYIIGGTKSELANQIFSFMELYFMRLLLDLPAVFSDPNVASMASAANIFSWVVYLVVIIAEPACDAFLLVNNGKVALLKKNCFMTPVGIPKYLDALGDGVNESLKNGLKTKLNDLSAEKLNGYKKTEWKLSDELWPMGYADYLLVSMTIFTKKEQVLSRFADIVQMEAAKYYNKPSFSLDKSYTCISCNASVSYYPLISVFENAGLTNFTVDYEQDRSY